VNRKLLRIAAMAAVAALVIGGYSAWRAYTAARSQLSESRCDGHEQFIRSQWMDTALVRSRLAIRGCMVDDLLDTHELRGMTRAQVVALIGEPDSTRDFPEYDMVYWLGPQRGLIGTDSEYLAMKLDKARRVRSVELIVG
jgi:outer membrane protein assembly factor BamE (lipoprotein component of BamABCDE complex)